MNRCRIIAVVSAIASLSPFATAIADEGMWTFDNFPSAAVEQAYGVKIDSAWLDRVRIARRGSRPSRRDGPLRCAALVPEQVSEP